jgi:serine/threonine-protein kinase RsbW
MADEPRERLLSRLGGSAPIGLAAFDSHLRYVAINDWLAELNGNTVDAHLGRTVRDVIPELADQLEPIMREIFAGGDPVYGISVVGAHRLTGEMRFTEASFFGLDDAHGRRMALGCVVVDTTARERALSRVALLQDAITAVTAAADAKTAAQALVTNALEAVDAQGTGIAFATEDGFLEFVAVAGPLGELMAERHPRIPIAADAPMCDAYRRGRAVWLPTRDAWTSQYPQGAFLVENGARAAFVAPLEAAVTGRRLGILGVVFAKEPQLDPDDLAVVTAFAQQAAQALERIVLYDSERILRERFQLLATLGARLDEEMNPRDRIAAFLEVVVPRFAASARVDLAGGEPARALTLGCAPAGTDALEFVQLPLVARGEPFGSVTFGRVTFSAGDHVLAVELCRRLANALENAALYERERKIAETLQLSLLPRHVPDVPAARVWARYLPGTDLVVGGDFWDVIELPYQRLLLVVGDVAGRGEPAAIVMGRLRTVIRSLANAEITPADLISALNRFLVDHEDEMATCLCAVLDQTTGAVRVANAGHPPLLRISRSGQTAYLGGATGLPLGVRAFATYEEVTFSVEPGELLVLFTDGLVERRDEPIDDRLELLATRAREAAAHGDAWCDRIVEAMIGERRDDDVALLGIRIEQLRTPELRVEVPAELAHLRHVRDRVRGWLVARQVLQNDIDAVLLAVGEATGNVAVHAYGAAGGLLHVHAVLDDELLEVAVRDDGRWRAPLDDRGQGLRIIGQLADTMDVDTSEAGTKVTFTRQLATAPPS